VKKDQDFFFLEFVIRSFIRYFIRFSSKKMENWSNTKIYKIL